MKRDVYRYRFPNGTDMEQVADTLLLSALAAEGLYGRSRLKLETSIQCDRQARSARVSTRDAAGQAVAQIFAALLEMLIGGPAFTVDHAIEEV